LFFSKLKPAVSKVWLAAAAGLMWSAVGLMLCGLAYEWLAAVPFHWAGSLGATGIGLAFAFYNLTFSRIARKNLERLREFPDRVCFFAFQAWKSYLLIVLMVMFGFMLRRSSIPRYWLSVPYTAIGGALLLASFQYHFHVWRVLFPKNPGPY
jgi:hypothetical protein